MNTASELRAELAQVFAKLKAGEIKPGEAAELANLAGKMIGSAKVQVEYYALRKESPDIAFLKDDRAIGAHKQVDEQRRRDKWAEAQGQPYVSGFGED